jgi:hypothetical protein
MRSCGPFGIKDLESLSRTAARFQFADDEQRYRGRRVQLRGDGVRLLTGGGQLGRRGELAGLVLCRKNAWSPSSARAARANRRCSLR